MKENFAYRLVLVTLFAALAALWILFGGFVVKVAHAETPIMCHEPRQFRTVYIASNLPGVSERDVQVAMSRWNAAAGRSVFYQVFGPTDQNVSIVPSSGRTWVDSCGAKTTIYVGSLDAYRNADWITHELGHALFFPDYTNSPTSGHINPQPCGAYHGIMSYCTSPQNWLQCYEGIYDDCDLLHDYLNSSR